MYDSPDQRIAALEARIAVTEKTINTLMTLVMPAVGLMANEQGERMLQLLAAMDKAKTETAESNAQIAANLEAMQLAICEMGEQLKELVDDADEGESWKKGAGPDA